VKIERHIEVRDAARTTPPGRREATSHESRFGEVLERKRRRGEPSAGEPFASFSSNTSTREGTIASRSDADDAALAPFNVPASILLPPAPLARPVTEATHHIDAAQAIAQRIVDSVRIESTASRVEMVVETRTDVLGGVEIRVRHEHGQIHASFATAQPEARALLEAQLGTLRDALSQRGLLLAEVTVAHNPRGSSGDSSGARDHSGEEPSRRNPRDPQRGKGR
jgi:flagellar hook-length control protein FliK